MLTHYTQKNIIEALRELNQQTKTPWQIQGNTLYKEFIFADFVEAFAFMSSLAIHAEKANHHPHLSNIYNKVTIGLTTHELGAISQRDFDLAYTIEKLIRSS